MKRDVVVSNTHYSLLLYFLIKENYKDSLYITNDPLIYEFLRNRNFEVEFLSLQYIDKVVEMFTKLKNEEYRKSLNFIGADHIECYYILRKYIDSFTLLEDGLKNYRYDYEEEMKKMFPEAGLDEIVKKIILTGVDEIPKEIKHKVEIINIGEKWVKKSVDEKNELLRMYNITMSDLDLLNESEVVFFSQPLTEDGFTKLEEELDLYDKLLKKYENKKVLIKKHPREVKSYAKLIEKYPNIKIFEKQIPVELFSLLGIEFDIVSTAFSTAVLKVKAKEINFYGTKINDQILECFGDIKLF